MRRPASSLVLSFFEAPVSRAEFPCMVCREAGESLNITMLRKRFADTGQLAFVAHIRADGAFAHPESFVKLIGVKP